MIARDQRLDSFTRSYIETALWSSMDNANDQGGEPLDANYGPDDIDPETMAQMITDCTSFQDRNAGLLSDSGLADKRAGFYFWLSRNGHGSGFFDEDLDALQDAAKAYGSFDLYVGDDGVIYGSPLDTRGGVNEARRGQSRHDASPLSGPRKAARDEAISQATSDARRSRTDYAVWMDAHGKFHVEPASTAPWKSTIAVAHSPHGHVSYKRHGTAEEARHRPSSGPAPTRSAHRPPPARRRRR